MNILNMIQLIRLIFGIALAFLVFAPFGVYHSISEPYVSGLLWGYNLPVGYVGLLLGILVILYPKFAVTRGLRFSSILIIIGLSLYLAFILSPTSYFINLLHGTDFTSGQIDVDSPIGNLIVVWLSLFSVASGLVLGAIHSQRLSVDRTSKKEGKV